MMKNIHTTESFWNKKPGRYYEIFVVSLFLALPLVGLIVSIAIAMQNPPLFWTTLGWIGVLIAGIVLHIEVIRPKLWKYPLLPKSTRLLQAYQRMPKAVYKMLPGLIVRMLYRVAWVGFIACIYWQLYQLHGSALNWHIGKYLVAGFGITIGYHRLPHKSFKAPPWLEHFLYGAGSLANQGVIAEWLRKHLKHHFFADTSADVHSPNVLEQSRRGIALAWWTTFLHSFIFWAIKEPSLRKRKHQTLAEWKAELLANGPKADTFLYLPEDEHRWGTTTVKGVTVTTQQKLDKAWAHYVDRLEEIEQNTIMQRMSHPAVYLSIFVIGNFAIPYYLGGISVWASLANLLFLGWATFSVNSVSHLWGERPFITTDTSANNAYVEIVAAGEGGHNTHHYRAASAVHGVYAWQFDPSAHVILFWKKIRLITDVRLIEEKVLMHEWRKWMSRLKARRT